MNLKNFYIPLQGNLHNYVKDFNSTLSKELQLMS